MSDKEQVQEVEQQQQEQEKEAVAEETPGKLSSFTCYKIKQPFSRLLT